MAKQGGYLSLRISEATKVFLTRAAKSRGLKLSTWLKSIAIDEAKRVLGEPAPDLFDEETDPSDEP